MKTLKLFTFYILGVSLLHGQSSFVIANPDSLGISNEKLQVLKNKLHEYVDDNRLAGIQTAILKKDKLVYFDSYGYLDIENKKMLDNKSVFRIFSMTKPITSVGLMMLYEQGKFKLKDPLYKYIPEFKNMMVYDENQKIVPAKNSIRIIDLLRHSSGISYGRSPNQDLNTRYSKENLGQSKNLKTFINKISKLPLLFEPGTAYEYGYSTDICGYLIEVLSGKPINVYLQEKVLNPLKMKDTYFQLPKEKLQHFTTGYRAGENGKLEIADVPEQSMFVNEVTFFKGGGGLVSTTRDYLNFCQMLLNKGVLFGNQILNPETVDLMTRDHLTSVRKHTPRLRILPRETGFGLGFSVAEQNDGRIVYGWGGAVGTYFRIDPEQDLAYVMMIQLSPYRQLNLRETFQDLVNDAMIDIPKHYSVVNPILLDKSILSGKGLKIIELKDQPNREFFQSQLYHGETLSAYVISSSTASKNFDNFSIDEFIYLKKGFINFEPENNDPLEFEVNDFIIIPKGYSGSIETVGKPKYHLELSIISNKRADKDLVSKIKSPIYIDNHLLTVENSKLNNEGIYKSLVYSGLELEVNFIAKKPRHVSIENTPKEQCIHILEGFVNITPKNGKTQTFSKGDFFILPKGFNGIWDSNSQKLFRLITIEAKELFI